MPKLNFLLIAIITTTLGCQKATENDNRPISPARQAPALIGASFKVPQADSNAPAPHAAPDSPLAGHDGLIEIRKSSLNKAFLLTPAITIGSISPIRMDYRPKVVSFERHGGQIALCELNFLSVYDDLPGDHLMQAFIIEKESEESVTIRWNYGLTYVPTSSAYLASDFTEDLLEEMRDLQTGNETVLPIAASFVRSISIAKNSLRIEQAVRARSSSGTGFTQDTALTVSFHFSPYVKNDGFERKRSAMDSGIGFFEVLAGKKGAFEMNLLAEHWDLRPEKGLVTYRVTKNVPEAYRQTIADGVTYWNRVLGREAFRVIQGEELDSEPSYREVIIHWLPFENAGFALASWQADPLSGELLRGNIYLPSDWRRIGRQDARQTAKTLGLLEVTPDDFKAATACIQPLGRNADPSERASLMKADLPPAIIEKAVQDTILLVVAHEVGHTLGLRHNFAGSIDTELASEGELQNRQREYLRDVESHGAVISSTVMDYFTLLGDALLGAAIRERVLAYDRQAIGWAYSQMPIAGNLAFCSDSDRTKKLLGCATFDFGKNPLAHEIARGAHNRDNFARVLFTSIIDYVFPEMPENKVSLKEVLARFPLALWSADVQLRKAFAYLQNDSAVMSVKMRYPYSTEENRPEEYRRETAAALKTAIDETGGLAHALRQIYPLEANRPARGWMRAQVEELAQRSELMQGVTTQGVAYQLSPEEFAQVIDFLRMSADQVEEKRLVSVLSGLTTLVTANPKKAPTGLTPGIGQETWQAPLGEFAASILNDSEGSVSAVIDGAEIIINKPVFSPAARARAAQMLSPTLYNQYGWQVEVAAQSKNIVLQRLQKIAGTSSDNSALLEKALKRRSLTGDLRTVAESDLAVLRVLESW